MTVDNFYFGRSKFAVLPESRNDLVDENLLAFSKLQKFCQSLTTLQLLYLSTKVICLSAKLTGSVFSLQSSVDLTLRRNRNQQMFSTVYTIIH